MIGRSGVNCGPAMAGAWRAHRVWPRLCQAARSLGRDAAGMGVLIGCLKAGGLVQPLLGLPIPGSVAGLCLLLGLLAAGIVPEELVRRAAAAMLFVLPALFIPLYAAPISDPEFWLRYGWTLLPAALVGAVVTLFVTGRIAGLLVRS